MSHRSRAPSPVVRALFIKVGVVPLILAAFVVLAAIWQSSCHFPGFRWHQPLQRVWDVGTAAGTPALLALAYLLGLATRPGAIRERFMLPTDGRYRWWRYAVAIFVMLVSLILLPDYEVWDYFAFGLVPIAFARRSSAPSKRHLLEWLGIAVCWTLVSYVLTVFKASVFMHQSMRDDVVVAAETWLFGTPPHRIVADWIASRWWAVRSLDWIYFRHFASLLTAGAFLAGARLRKETLALAASVFLAYLVGSVCYHLLPVKGPVYFEPERFHFLSQGILATHETQDVLDIGTTWAVEGRLLDLPPFAYIASMPSLHICHATITLWFSRHSRPFFILNLVFLVATLIATLGLGWHYLLDAPAGALLAALVIAFVYRVQAVLWPSKNAHLLFAPKNEEVLEVAQ